MKSVVLPFLFCLSRAHEYVQYDNYSFNYADHKPPIAYTPYQNTIELHNAVKLNSKILNRGGAYVLDKEIRWSNF